MAGKGASIFIDRPAEEVFEYLIELNDARWRSGVTGMTLVSDSYEGVGSTHVELRRLLKWSVKSRAEVVAYEPNCRWAVRRASGPIRPQVTYTLEHEGEGTRLRFEFGVPVLRGAARMLAPLVRVAKPVVERATSKDLERLKHQLEDRRSQEDQTSPV